MIKCEKDRNEFQTVYDLGNVHDCNNGISGIHGKELPEQLSIANNKNLTLKQMFDISTRLVSDQDEISGLETIGWENHSWKYLSLIGDERVVNLQRTKVYVFSDSVLCLGKIFENPQSNDAWEQRLEWLKSSSKYRNFDRIDGEPMEFEWNIFPGYNTLQLDDEVKSLLLELDETPENFTGRIIFMSMFNDRCCISEDSPQGVWDNMTERMLLEFAESGCPIFRATSPLSRGRLKSKGHGKLSIHYAADLETIETIFRIIVSANQLSLYGAIAEICEEYESLHERTGRPVVIWQSSSSLVLSVIKTEVPLDCDDAGNQDLLLQQYGERIEKLSQQDKLSKFCMDAGFLNIVEIGQNFRTKDTAYFSQFHAVACREYTLPREEEASQPKGWIQGNTKIGPVLEVATIYLHGKYGAEIRIWSVNRDNAHSSVRISHGSNRFVVNLNNNESEIPGVQLKENALKLDAKDFAMPIKGKSKTTKKKTC